MAKFFKGQSLGQSFRRKHPEFQSCPNLLTTQCRISRQKRLCLNISSIHSALSIELPFVTNTGRHRAVDNTAPASPRAVNTYVVCWTFLRTYIHTYTRLTALFPGLPRWADTRKVKPIGILLKQKTVSGSGISWAICKSAPRFRQITTPAPHHSVFYRPAALPAAQPTASKHWRDSKHWREPNWWY